MHNYDGRVGGDAYHLGCVKQGDDFIYKREGVADCLIIALSNISNHNPITRIYPNPIFEGGLLSIDTEYKFCRVELVNSLGQIVCLEEFIGNQNIIRIDNSPGIYFYRLKNNEDKLILVGKLIIVNRH